MVDAQDDVANKQLGERFPFVDSSSKTRLERLKRLVTLLKAELAKLSEPTPLADSDSDSDSDDELDD